MTHRILRPLTIAAALLAFAAPAAAAGQRAQWEQMPTEASTTLLPAHEWSSPVSEPKGVMVTIHSGGWVGVGAQDLALERTDVSRYNRLGWTVLNIDYRAGAGSIRDVIHFYDLARQRFGYHMPICSSGQSAGGHLAMLLAAYRPRLACAISQEGPADLRPLLAGRTLPSLAYVVACEFGAEAREMSPATRLHAYRGRVLATYSTDDQIIPGSDQVVALQNMAARVRVMHVSGTPEAAPGTATWVHINPAPGALDEFYAAERHLLAANLGG